MIKKRPDKIFNNGYYHGNKQKGDTYRFDNRIEADQENLLNSGIVSSFNPEVQYPYSEIEEVILTLVDTNDDIQEILKNNKKKFNKQKINQLFQLTTDNFNTTIELRRIKVYIYIFDVISRLTGIRHLNLFDLLDLEYKEFLLEELDETYSIYDNFSKENKFF